MSHGSKELHTYIIRLFAPESEFDPGFVQAMANRMSVSFHKYGFVADGHGNIDWMASMDQRIEEYKRTGNTELLADVANFAMIENMRNPHSFRATDSDESPGRTRLGGTVDAERN